MNRPTATETPVPVPDPTLQPTISVEHAGRLMGICRTSAYSAVNRGEIPVVKIGRLLRVPTARFVHEILGFERATSQTDEVVR